MEATALQGLGAEAEGTVNETMRAPPPVRTILAAEDRIAIPVPLSAPHPSMVRPRLRAGGLAEE